MVFACGFVGASVIGFTDGTPYQFFAGIDGDGNMCGYSEGYENYTYLYFWSLEADNIWYYAVCVSECPTSNTTIDCKTTSYVTDCNDGEHYDTYDFGGEYCLPNMDTLSAELLSAPGL